MRDEYAHIRAAFHTAADGLMEWQNPPEGPVHALRAIERAADSLLRLGDRENALALYALALRLGT